MRLKVESGSTISGRATKGWESGDRRRGKMRKICFANFLIPGRRRSRAGRVSMPRWIYGGRGYRFLFSPFRPTTHNFFSADIAMLVNYFVYRIRSPARRGTPGASAILRNPFENVHVHATEKILRMIERFGSSAFAIRAICKSEMTHDIVSSMLIYESTIRGARSMFAHEYCNISFCVWITK